MQKVISIKIRYELKIQLLLLNLPKEYLFMGLWIYG